MFDIVEMAKSSHLTKLFDGSVISDEKFDVLKAVLRSAPSSLNIQATHYVVAASQASKARIAKAVQGGYELNLPKIFTASHVIVFCSRVSLPSSHMDEVAEQERADGRFPNAELESRWREIVRFMIGVHEYDLKDLAYWIDKQTYLAVGIALMAAAELGISTLCMEGFNPKVLDQELGLREKGYTSSVLMAFGYQSSEDYVIGTPKSRLPEAKLFSFLD
jgi:nitroreductase/dihydropteridine reductase